MATFEGLPKSAKAGEALEAHRLVLVSDAGEISYYDGGADADCVGATLDKAESGKPVTFLLRGLGMPIVENNTNAVIGAGTKLMAAADGKVTTLTQATANLAAYVGRNVQVGIAFDDLPAQGTGRMIWADGK